MINLKSLLLEIKSPYIVVGIIDGDLNVVSANNIHSHFDLVKKFPDWSNRSPIWNWRFNANDQTLYWYNQPDDKMTDVVKSEIKSKYPYYHVTRQSRIDSNDITTYQKKQRSAHGMN